AWTISAGRNLAVRRSELGNTTKITSPRLKRGFGGVVVIIDVHLGLVPFGRERPQASTQFGSMRLIDTAPCKIKQRRCQKGDDDLSLLGKVLRLFSQDHLSIAIHPCDACEHCIPPQAGALDKCGESGQRK